MAGRDDTASSDHDVRSQRDTRTNKGIGSDPGVPANRYGASDEIETRLTEIVGSCAQKGALRKTSVMSKRDGREIVQLHFFANPAMVANAQPPGKRDIDARTDDHTFANRCAE